MNTVKIKDIIIPKRHRDIKSYVLARLVESMQNHGYNPSFPITIEEDNTLIDGRHRIAAAELCGIDKVPYTLKPDGVLALAHSVRCNADQKLGSEDDVFDLATYCSGYAQDGWLGQQIAEALGWSETATVTNHKKIKEKLHPMAWSLAKNGSFAKSSNEPLVNCELAIANWKESHFRFLLKYLAWEKGDHATMRAQIQIISEILDRFVNPPKDRNGKEQKVTAAWIEEIAKRYAWYIKLKKHANDNLKPWVKLRARIGLFQNISRGIFSNEESEAAWERFTKAVEALNGKVPRLIVGRAEAMTEIESDSIDLIVTSPPYNLDEENWPMGGDGRTPRENGIGYDQHKDAIPEDEYQKWQLDCLKEMYRVAKEGASLFYNHKVRIKSGRAIHPMEWLGHKDNPWILRQEIIWDRGSTHNHCPVLFWPYDERIYWLTKGKPNLPEGRLIHHGEDTQRSTIWHFHGPIANTWHPAPFSPELPRRCIEAIGWESITVLDPFAGSCITLKVAMEEFGCDAIGIDISEEYLERAKRENGWMIENEI